MTKYKFGDIVLVLFTHQGNTQKKRPALVILDIGDDDVILAPITTTERKNKGDHKIKDWQKGGLLLKSWVRLAKIACFEKNDIERILGKLTTLDKSKIANIWQEIYKL